MLDAALTANAEDGARCVHEAFRRRIVRDRLFPVMPSLAHETGPLPSRQCVTLADVLRWRATHQPDGLGYRFLLDGEAREVGLTYGDLDRRARAIAAALLSRGADGARALLVYPPGLDFICAWFACAYAGAAAVAVPPPQTARARRFMSAAAAIAGDARPVVALTTTALRQTLPADGLGDAPWLVTDDELVAPAGGAGERVVGAEDVAFLQYTSGSTTAPKGVVVTHANLMANLRAIERTFWRPTDEGSVSWLPPYHDMGLIGGIIQPLYGGFPVVLLSPVDFLQRPLRWLQAITRVRGAVSGGPNFAYEQCVRRITQEQAAGLDLSSWRVAFNGAEPVHDRTIREFTARFAPCGFAPEAFKPCYGLAEATLLVSVNATAAPPRVETFRRAQLERHQVVACAGDADDTDDARALVSCGQPVTSTVIVDPETLEPCPPGRVGEIWVAGPDVAMGYWNQPGETERTFGARLRGAASGRFLRTGDLGFLLDGELFVTGRLKDLVIIEGTNHYPQDIERTVSASHPALEPGDCAAFSLDVAGREALVVVAAVQRSAHAAVADVQRAIRAAVSEQHDLRIHDLVLVRRGDIPKTVSGKVRRHACKAAYLARTLVMGAAT